MINRVLIIYNGVCLLSQTRSVGQGFLSCIVGLSEPAIISRILYCFSLF